MHRFCIDALLLKHAGLCTFLKIYGTQPTCRFGKQNVYCVSDPNLANNIIMICRYNFKYSYS